MIANEPLALTTKEMKRLDLNRVYAVLQLMNEYCDNLPLINRRFNDDILSQLSKYKLLSHKTIKLLRKMFLQPNAQMEFEPLIINHFITCPCSNNEYIPYTIVIEELEKEIAKYLSVDTKVQYVKFNFVLPDSDYCSDYCGSKYSKEPKFKSIDWSILLQINKRLI
jgi:hypothetical protein